MNFRSKDLATKGYCIAKTCFLILCFFMAGNLMGGLYFKPREIRKDLSNPSLYSDTGEDTKERFKVNDLQKSSELKVRQISELKDLEIDLPKRNLYGLQDIPNVNEFAPPPGVYKFHKEDAFLSSAFIDFRFTKRCIRTFILHKMNKQLEVYCHVKCKNGSTVSVKSSQKDIHPDWPENNVYVATGYFCDLPESIKTLPSESEFSLNQNGKRFSLRLIPVAPEFIGPKDRNENVGACVKSITGNFPPSQITEWTEFHKLIGINFFTFFNASLSGKGNDVLNYYVKENKAQIYQFPLMTYVIDYEEKKQPLNRAHFYSIQQQLYLISIQDCLYRLMNKHKYILLVDMDELLTPFKEESIQSLLNRAWKANTIAAAGVMFSTGWYFDDFQQKNSQSSSSVLKMVNRHRRTAIQDNQPKSILNSDMCVQANWHGPVTVSDLFTPMNAILNNQVSYKNYGYIHHFRGLCIEKFYSKDCKKMLQNSFEDEILGRYVPVMEKNVKKIKGIVKF